MPRGKTARRNRQAHRAKLAADIAATRTMTLEQAQTAVAGIVGVSKAEVVEAAGLAEPSPERLLLEEIRALAMRGECSNCGHLAIKHLGAENSGPCSEEDCGCNGMVEADDDEGEDPGETSSATVYLTISEEAQQAAVAALAAGVTVSSAPEPFLAPALEAEREHFVERLTFRLEQLVAEFADDVSLPAEHEPGEDLPERTPGGDVVSEPAPVAAGGVLAWRASLVPEGRLTDDGRAFAPGSLTWRELPLSLMGMVKTADGHDGAEVSGRIDRVWRDAAGMVWGEGIFDPGEFGSEIGRMVGDGTLRGVSVDVAIHSYEVGPRSDWFDEDGNWAPKPEQASDETALVDLLMGESDEPVIMVVTEGVIGAATVCPFQAFADAKIELAASLVASPSPALWTHTQQAGWTVTSVAHVGEADGVEKTGIEVALGEEAELSCGCVTASAAGLAPVEPPAEWFENPGLAELTPLTITDDGRVFGHAAAWDTCHMGIPDVCTTAPHSNTSYAYFLLKEVACEGGDLVPCGTITLDTGHADRGLGRVQAAAHYDDTGLAVADVAAGEDEYGIWVAGAVRPDMDAERVRDLRGAVLSGDWRNVNGNLELVALLAVNVPGFPVPRTRALVAAGEDGSEVLALVAAGVHNGPPGPASSEEALAKVAALAERVAPRLHADAAARIAELVARAA